jgi:hypothetical protein
MVNHRGTGAKSSRERMPRRLKGTKTHEDIAKRKGEKGDKEIY